MTVLKSLPVWKVRTSGPGQRDDADYAIAAPSAAEAARLAERNAEGSTVTAVSRYPGLPFVHVWADPL